MAFPISPHGEEEDRDAEYVRDRAPGGETVTDSSGIADVGPHRLARYVKIEDHTTGKSPSRKKDFYQKLRIC